MNGCGRTPRERQIPWQGPPQTDTSSGLVELQQLLKLQEFGLLGFQVALLVTGVCMMVPYHSPSIAVLSATNQNRFHQESPSSLDLWSVADLPDQEQQLRRQVQLQEQQFQLQEMQLQQQEPGAGTSWLGCGRLKPSQKAEVCCWVCCIL